MATGFEKPDHPPSTAHFQISQMAICVTLQNNVRTVADHSPGRNPFLKQRLASWIAFQVLRRLDAVDSLLKTHVLRFLGVG
jgi:hypothetical protein